MKFQLPKSSDTFLIEKLTATGRELADNWTITVHFGHGSVVTLNGNRTTETPWSGNALADRLHKSAGFSGRTFQLLLNGTHALTVERKETAYDELDTYDSRRWGDNDNAQIFYVGVCDVACRNLLAVRAEGGPSYFDPEFTKVLAARETGLTRLEELLGRFTGDLASYRRK